MSAFIFDGGHTSVIQLGNEVRIEFIRVSRQPEGVHDIARDIAYPSNDVRVGINALSTPSFFFGVKAADSAIKML